MRLVAICAGAAVALWLSGCVGGSGQDPSRPAIDVLQSSAYCNTPGEDAAVHYFPDPPAFGEWIDARDVREFRRGAASLSGVLVVEMGRRPTAGYGLTVREGASRIHEGNLVLALEWTEPEEKALVAQVVTAPCIVIKAPAGDYDRVVVKDQSLETRAAVELPAKGG